MGLDMDTALDTTYLTPAKKPLDEHLFAVYRHLRWGMALVAFSFPLILWFGGLAIGLPLQESMSAYYFAEIDGLGLRDVFVGLLFAIGTSLYLYKGFSRLENVLLNCAGLFEIGIGLFPMGRYCGTHCAVFSPHGLCAVGFFVCIAAVAWGCCDDTLQYVDDAKIRARYRRLYRFLALAIVAVPVAVYVLRSLLGMAQTYVFFIELAATWVFAAYWMVKSIELQRTHSGSAIADRHGIAAVA